MKCSARPASLLGCVASLLPLVVCCLLPGGCAAIGSDVYRKGAIQTSYVSGTIPRSESPATDIVIGVPPFEELRRNKTERNSLWMSLVPVLSFGARWDRPDWLLWDETFYAGYKSVGQDMAEVFAEEFEKSKLFSSTTAGEASRSADLLLKGNVIDLTLTERPHFLGISLIPGQILGQFGLPLGNWQVTQSLDLSLVSAKSGEILWQERFDTSDSGIAAAYYGGDPMRCGYPADTLLNPVVEKVLKEVEAVLASKGRPYWQQVASSHMRPKPPYIPPPPDGSVSQIANRYAVIVGVSSYEDSGRSGLTDLAYADDDARAFRKTLVAQGWDNDHIRCLIDQDATKEKIEDALASWLTKAGKDDLVVLFWSGHGYPDPADTRRVYFACYDTDIAKPHSGWRMDLVMDRIEELKSRNVLVIADTCHAGNLIVRGDDKGIAVRPYVEELRDKDRVPPGWIYMVSAEADRKAVEHSSWSNGAFTHCLILGLSGKADADLDGRVTMLELKAYMSSAMPEETLRVLKAAKHPVILTNSSDSSIWNLTLKAE